VTAEMTPESKFRGAGSAAARTAGSAGCGVGRSMFVVCGDPPQLDLGEP